MLLMITLPLTSIPSRGEVGILTVAYAGYPVLD